MLINILKITWNQFTSKHLAGLCKNSRRIWILSLWRSFWLRRIRFLAQSANHFFFLFFIHRKNLFLVFIWLRNFWCLFYKINFVIKIVMLVLDRIFLARLQRFDRIILRFKRLILIFLIFLIDSLLLAYYLIVSAFKFDLIYGFRITKLAYFDHIFWAFCII